MSARVFLPTALLVGGCADPATAAGRLTWGKGSGEPLNGDFEYLDEDASVFADLYVFVRGADSPCGAPAERKVEIIDEPGGDHIVLSLLTGRNLDNWAWCWGDTGQNWHIRASWEATAGSILLAWDGACRYEDESLVSRGHLAVTLVDVTLERTKGWASGGRIHDLALPEVELLVSQGYAD